MRVLAAAPARAAGTDEARPRRTSTTRRDSRPSRPATGNARSGNLNVAAAAEPTNADLQNWLGFAYRHEGKYDEALDHYRTALHLDPKHRGAHEYIGETYLLMGNKAKAREHLAALERICGKDCAEYRDLAKAIATAK